MKNKKVLKSTIILSLVIAFIGVAINFAFYKPTVVNKMIATKLYNESANDAFTDANFYSCVVDSYNAESDASVAYTESLTDEQLASIKEVSCSYLDIESASGVEKLTGLSLLNISGNPIQTIDVSSNTQLNRLYVYDCSLTAIDITNQLNLVELDVSLNYLDSLDLSLTTELVYLDVSYNELTNLDVSNNSKLNYLDVDWNLDLESITLSTDAQENLATLDISNTLITNFEPSNYPKLEYLGVEGLGLETLDVTQNTELIMLGANENYLSTIDVTKNTKLLLLGVAYNNLTSINLSENTELLYLNVSNNYLSNIDLSANEKLEGIYIDGNEYVVQQAIYVNEAYDLDNAVILPASATNTLSTTTIDVEGLSINNDKWLGANAGAYENVVLTYNHSLTNFPEETGVSVDVSAYDVTYDIYVIEATSDVYEVNPEDIYIGTQVDDQTILDNIDINYGTEEIIDNQYVIKYNEEVIKTFNIIADEDTTTYTINKQITGEGTTTLSKEESSAGETVTITNTPAEGYYVESVFMQLENGGEEICVADKTECSFEMPAANVTIQVTYTARNEEKPYIITLTPNDNGTATLSVEEANVGDAITLTIEPNEGYELSGVNVETTSGETITVTCEGTTCTFTMPESDVVVEVIYKLIQIKLTGDISEGGTTTFPETINYGESAEIINTPDEGYYVKSVIISGSGAMGAGAASCTDNTNTVCDTGSLTVDVTISVEYALLEDATYYSITKNITGEGETILSAETGKTGDEITITNTPAEGYYVELVSMNLENGGQELDSCNSDKTECSFTMPDGNVEIIVIYKVVDEADKIYKITKNTDENGVVTLSQETFQTNDIITITSEPNEGYEVVAVDVKTTSGKTLTAQCESNSTFCTFTLAYVEDGAVVHVEEDVVVEVTFGKKTYSISTNITGEGETTYMRMDGLDPNKFEFDSWIQFSNVSATDYVVSEVSVVDTYGNIVESSCANPENTVCNFAMPASDVVINVVYLTKYTYTHQLIGGNGWIHTWLDETPIASGSGEQKILEGTDVQLKAYPYDKYAPIIKINDADGNEVEKTCVKEEDGTICSFVMPSSNVLAEVSFEIPEYTIEINKDSGGVIDIETEKSQAGKTITFTNAINTDYELQRIWYEDEAGNEVDITCDGILTQTCSFKMPESNITINTSYLRKYKFTYELEGANFFMVSAGNSTIATSPGEAKIVEGTQVLVSLIPKEGYNRTIEIVDTTGTPVQHYCPAQENGTIDCIFKMPSDNVKFKATYEAIEYNITVGEYENGVTEVASTAYFGDKVTIKNTADTGYGVYNDSLTITGPEGEIIYDCEHWARTCYFTMPSGDVTIEVKYSPIQYNINLELGDFGDTDIAESSTYGSTVVFNNTTVDGYIISDIIVSTLGGQELTTNCNSIYTQCSFTMPAENVNVRFTYMKGENILGGYEYDFEKGYIILDTPDTKVTTGMSGYGYKNLDFGDEYTYEVQRKNIDSDYIGTGSVVTIYSSGYKVGEYTVIAKGDVTGDGVVNVADVSKLFKHLRKTESIEEDSPELLAGNVAGDALEIRINDVGKIFQFFRNIIETLKR